MYKKLSNIAEFLYGKLPEFHRGKVMKALFYHLRIWLGVIGSTWFALCVITGYIADTSSFEDRFLTGLGIWIGIWFILKIGTVANN